MVAENPHDVFQAIADPTRRNLLGLLADKELSIAAITERFPISRTAINKHLHVLSDSGLVSSQRVGRETRYRLEPRPLLELKLWLSAFDRYWDEQLISLRQYVESDER
jgi:DNA-binding transcriptional ArsR family regulator